MTPEQIAEVRPRLEAFAERMLGGLARSDQRQTGSLYVRGLLLDGQRKSMQPMAERLGVDHQRLQQFVTSSTWDHTPVRRNLATWADGLLAGSVFVVDDVGFIKDGTASPGVARMYCGALGKRGNCQIGVSVHLATDAASAAVDWRLFVPESWDDTTISDPAAAEAVRHRRTRAKIPDTVGHRPKWQLALDMLDELTTGWGLTRRPVVADAGYGEVTAFRLGLEARGLPYALAVPATLSAHPAHATPIRPPYTGRGQPPKPRYPTRPASLRDLALAAEATAWTTVTWRHGTRRSAANPTAALRGRFAALRVRPASREIPRAPDRSVPERWLLVEWPPGATEPSDYWLSDLPADTPITDLVGLAKRRWRIEHDYRELKTGLGLDHYEGRSFAGWHRHVTLTALAQAFCTQLRLDPKAPAPA